MYLMSGIILSTLFLFTPYGSFDVQAARTREEACDTTLPPGLSNKCSNGLLDNNTCEFIPDGNGNLPWTNFTLSGSPNHEKTTYGHNGDTHILKISPNDGKDFVAGTYITFNTTPGKTYCASWRWGPNTDSSGSKNPFEKTMGLDPTGQTNAAAGSIVWGSTVKKTSRQLDYDPVGVDVDYNADIKTVATGNKMTLFIKAHFTASENSHVQIDQVNVFDEGVKNGITTAPTPTSQQPQATNTPAPVTSCPTSSSNQYDKRSIRNVGDRQPAENHPDKNIHVRGYTGTSQTRQIVFNGGDRDQSAPQFSTVLPNSRPAITRLFQVYNWNWGSGNDWGSKGGPQTNPWPVSVMGLSANPSDPVMLPDSGYNIGSGYEAFVLYASEDTLTAVYLDNDRAVGDNGNGYAVHFDAICVDPNLLSLYRNLNNQGRKELPALKGRQVVGTAKTSEVIVSMRDSGEFMDPRSDAWWLGIQSLPSIDEPQPTTTSVPNATSTPTATCNITNIPQFTAPQGGTVTSDSQYTVSWTTVPGATKYFLRINDLGTNNEESRFSGNCGVTQFPGDICTGGVTSNTFTYTFKNNHQYALWVHAESPCGFSDAGSMNVFASSASNSCVIQGYKHLATGPSTQDQIANPQVITVKSSDNTIVYTNQSNPYSFSVPGNQDYEVSTSLPSEPGYGVSSSLCINKTDCHSLSDPSLQTGVARSFRCPQSGYVDLWWHYELSSCAMPSAPIIEHVTRNPNGYIMPSIDEISFSWRSNDTPLIPYRYKIEMSTDNQQSWPTVLNNFKDTSSTTYINDNLPICIRVTAINSCGRNGNPSAVVCASAPLTPTPIASSPYPTPTLKPTTTQLQCYGTQHCTNGNSTMFEYCGNCEGSGCSPGFTCRDPQQKCESYPGKKFYFDEIYPIDCKLLSPTPTNSPLPVLTCSSCDTKNPYLCSTVSATAAGRAETSFCWDRKAPASTYNCTKCDIPSATAPTSTPVPNITYNPPAAAQISSQEMIKREKIGNLLERVTIQWNPIAEGNPKLELSLDGVTWETRLTGNGPYPYNYYSTTFSNSLDRPILVRLSVVTPDGQESPVTSAVIDTIADAPVEPTKSLYNLPTSSPISPAVIAVGGILVAVVIAGFMIGI